MTPVTMMTALWDLLLKSWAKSANLLGAWAFIHKKNLGHWGSSSHFDACKTCLKPRLSPLSISRHLYLISIRKRPGCLKPPTCFWKGSNDNAQRRCCGCWPRSARPLASFPPGLHQNRPKRRSTACSLSWVIAIAYSKCAWKTCSSATKMFL